MAVAGWKHKMESIKEHKARFGDKPPWNSANLDRNRFSSYLLLCRRRFRTLLSFQDDPCIDHDALIGGAHNGIQVDGFDIGFNLHHQPGKCQQHMG